jgi:hypothetical protein
VAVVAKLRDRFVRVAALGRQPTLRRRAVAVLVSAALAAAVAEVVLAGWIGIDETVAHVASAGLAAIAACIAALTRWATALVYVLLAAANLVALVMLIAVTAFVSMLG